MAEAGAQQQPIQRVHGRTSRSTWLLHTRRAVATRTLTINGPRVETRESRLLSPQTIFAANRGRYAEGGEAGFLETSTREILVLAPQSVSDHLLV